MLVARSSAAPKIAGHAGVEIYLSQHLQSRLAKSLQSLEHDACSFVFVKMCGDDSNSLCLECGLCCNGVIFANGQLQPEDDASRLRSLGLKIAPTPHSALRTPKFAQPCACFDGCHCNIYSERPRYCREFECLLLKSVKTGHTDRASALRIIRTARKRVEKVKQLLRDLGNAEEDLAPGKRFRKVKRQMESSSLNGETAGKFGELTLAYHDLNMILSEEFYSTP